MYDNEEEIENLTPPEIVEQATRAANNLLPVKSAKTYEQFYSQFMNWRIKNKVSSFSENVLIVYFDELSKKLKSTSLWTHYSILKSTLCIKHKVVISEYPKLIALLKRKSEGYKPKKSKTFSTTEIKQFIGEAPDVKYLLTKVSINLSFQCNVLNFLIRICYKKLASPLILLKLHFQTFFL